MSTEDEGSVYLFRVHRSILSYHSSIFEGLFSLPPAPGVNEEYDGVPMVKMPDTYEDLLYFLEVLYGHEYVGATSCQPML